MNQHNIRPNCFPELPSWWPTTGRSRTEYHFGPFKLTVQRSDSTRASFRVTLPPTGELVESGCVGTNETPYQLGRRLAEDLKRWRKAG